MGLLLVGLSVVVVLWGPAVDNQAGAGKCGEVVGSWHPEFEMRSNIEVASSKEVNLRIG